MTTVSIEKPKARLLTPFAKAILDGLPGQGWLRPSLSSRREPLEQFPETRITWPPMGGIWWTPEAVGPHNPDHKCVDMWGTSVSTYDPSQKPLISVLSKNPT